MKSRHLGTKLKRMMVTLLTAALLLSDNTILYAAEAGTAQTAIVSELEQDVLEENADSVSAGDAEVGEDAAIGKGERPINNKGDIPDTEDDLGTLEEFDGTVSGGDAVTPGRLPE